MWNYNIKIKKKKLIFRHKNTQFTNHRETTVIQKALDEEKLQLKVATVAEAVEPKQNSDSTAKKQWRAGKHSLLLGIGIGIVLALGGTRLLSSQQAKDSTPAPPVVASQAPAQSVTVAAVKTSPVNRSLKATGTVAAFELIPVLSQATGLQIQQVLAEEGEWVKAGQVLARLDNSVLQAQLGVVQKKLRGQEKMSEVPKQQ